MYEMSIVVLWSVFNHYNEVSRSASEYQLEVWEPQEQTETFPKLVACSIELFYPEKSTASTFSLNLN